MENLNIMNPERTVASRLYEPVRSFLGFVRDESAKRLHSQSDSSADSVKTKSDTTYVFFNHDDVKAKAKNSGKLSD